MSDLFRRQPLRVLFGLAAACLLPAAAIAQQVTLRVHHFLPATSNVHINIVVPWCKRIAAESSGRLLCQIHPSMALGGTPQQLIDQARDGVVDVVWTLPTYSAGRFSKSEVFELPFMTRTGKGASQALWSYVQRHATDEFKGLRLLFAHTHEGSALHFGGGKSVRRLEDLKGLKIRSASRLNAKMLSALGATPVQMPLPGVSDALAKGVIDGAMVPWEGLPAIRLQEFAKSHLDVPAGRPQFSNSLFVFAMNEARYASLPDDLKKVIDANSGLALSAWAGERYDVAGVAVRRLARDHGNAIAALDPAEFVRWEKATANVESDWLRELAAKGIDGKALLEDARRLLGQYDR